MKDEKEIPATEVMEEQRKREAGCEERGKTIDNRFYEVFGRLGNDKRFDKAGDKIEKSGRSTDSWGITAICALILMMFFGTDDGSDFDDLNGSDDFGDF